MKTLTALQLDKLTSLTYSALEGDYASEWSRPDGYNAENIYLPISNYKELAEFVNSITGYSLDEITSMHYIKYVKGSALTRHKDEVMLDITNPDESISVVFMLQQAEEGGEFLLDDINMNFNTPGQYIEFDGKRTYHEVTTVTKGIREVLVMWYRPKKIKYLL